jgi:hypothetical protein
MIFAEQRLPVFWIALEKPPSRADRRRAKFPAAFGE